LKAIAEHPFLTKKLIDTSADTKEGQYIVNLYLNGKRHEIEVDDYIPYSAIMKRPASLRLSNNEIWPMLAEKAWTKVGGNHEKSITGMC
jgi:hypothetical protein